MQYKCVNAGKRVVCRRLGRQCVKVKVKIGKIIFEYEQR